MQLTVGENSYVTIEEAESIAFTAPRYREWDSIDSDDKKRYLLSAARYIDSLRFAGRKPVNQIMAFPRMGETDIPLAVKQAQVFEAMEMANIANSQFEKYKAAGVSSATVGNASISFGKSAEVSSTKMLCPTALLLLKPLLSSWAVFA